MIAAILVDQYDNKVHYNDTETDDDGDKFINPNETLKIVCTTIYLTRSK